MGKDKTTISKWCANSSQPDFESLMKTAKLLNVEVIELLRTNVIEQTNNYEYGNTKS